MTKLSLLCFALGLSACSKTYPPTNAVKVGKPYQVMGKTYEPAINPGYDEIGVASWYGPGFNGHRTASGETYDQNEMTAAHTTLPMPSLVRVTNLNNGKQAIVRVNDRGPYHTSRIIDLSKAAAKQLGVISTGTAQVRVQYLKEETLAYLEENKIAGREKIVMAAAAQQQPELIAQGPATVAQTQPNVVVAAAEPAKHKRSWGLISDAYADEIQQEPVQSGGVVKSQELPPIRPAYKTENNKGSSAPIFSTYKSSADVKAPFASPATQAAAPVAAPNSDTPALSRAMEAVDNGDVKDDEVKVQEAAPSAGASGVYVQAGSFGVKENAEALVSKLKNFGAQMTETQSSGKTIYRVRTGPLKSEGDAQDILARLSSIGVQGKIIRP